MYVPDPRKLRANRHPALGMLALIFLGLLVRIREMAVLQRWAETRWDTLQEPLGFELEKPAHATRISRAIADCELSKFADAFPAWVMTVVTDEPLTAAVDANTRCQGIVDDGQPVQLLTVLVHNVKLILGQWSVHGGKTNEPNVLEHHLAELTAQYPLRKLITGDAIYAQRPLAEALLDEDRDYLLQIKGSQPDIQDAVQNCLGAAHERKPATMTAEKKRTLWIGADWRHRYPGACSWLPF